MKGIFVTISVFFLALALLSASGLAASAKEKQAGARADLSSLSGISSIRSNMEWMAKDAYAVSGFRFTGYGSVLSIESNSSMRGHLSGDLRAIEDFWNQAGGAALSFEEDAMVPVMHIQPAGISVAQHPTNTSIVVPEYSGHLVGAYYIQIKAPCSSLSSSWNSLAESEEEGALDFALSLECTDSDGSFSTFKRLDRSAYSELQIMDSGANISVIRIYAPGSLEALTYKSSYLNIIIPMNERAYFEIPATASIAQGDSSLNARLAMPGEMR